MSGLRDPFASYREDPGVLTGEVRRCQFLMVLRYQDLRQVTRDWETYTSDVPFRVPIPPEHMARGVRQLPIETNPPATPEYRRIVEAPFSRSNVARIEPSVSVIADTLLDDALNHGRFEVLSSFALPLFVKALALMLDLPQDDAREWLTWGRYVFPRAEDGIDYAANTQMDSYLEKRLDEALAGKPVGFFGLLAHGSFKDRPLSRDEMLGLANLTLAGGRDTTTGAIVNSLHYLATQPEELEALRSTPELVPSAVEELLRYFSPLPYIGRILTRPAVIGGHAVPEGHTIALSFASANRDPEIFEQPNMCWFERRPNRHVAFGHGPHTCLGAPLARMIMKVTLEKIISRVSRLSVIGHPVYEVVDYAPGIRHHIGFERLTLEIAPLTQRPGPG